MKAVQIAKDLGQIKHVRINKVANAPLEVWRQIILAKIYQAALSGKDCIGFEMSHLSRADKVPPMYHDSGQPQPNPNWILEDGDIIVKDSEIDVRYALREFDRELYPFLVSEGFRVDVRSRIHQGLCLSHSYDGILIVRWIDK